jgi:hypothetical protein
MESAREILGIQVRARDLLENAESIVSNDTERKVSRAQKSFEKVVESRSTYSRRKQKDYGEVYRQFLRHYDEGTTALQSVFDTSRKVRQLAWALCYRGKEGEVEIARSRPHLRRALTVIENRWRWSSIFGIFDGLLRSWDCGKTRPVFQQFLSQKLNDYEGRRPRLLTLKEHRDHFLKSDGPTNVAQYLLQEDRPITETWEMLRLPDHVSGYPYVADLASAYTRNAMRAPSYRDRIRPILQFLSTHGRQSTYKRCLSLMVLRLDREEPVEERENVVQIAFRKIGDPARAPEWQPWEGATETEQDELESARQTLNNWIVQRFISAFFDKVAMDEDRRSFWLQYAPHVTRFKVFGDGNTRYKLRQDDRIRRYVDQRFDQIGGSMSALLMQIKNRIIVEFGEVGGACYIHRKGGPNSPSFDRRYSHIRELRLGTDFPLLMRYSGREYRDVKDRGRFLHKHDWERRLKWWMQRKLGVKV